MLAMGNRLKNKNDFRAPTPAEIHRHREGPSHAPAAIAASHGSATAGGGGAWWPPLESLARPPKPLRDAA